MYLIYLANNMNKERFYILLESKLGDVRPLISEQPDSKMPGQIEKFGYVQGKPETVQPALQKQEEYLKSIDPHTLNLIMSIGTAFIPLVGPFISSAIMVGDAALYAAEGDMKNAGLQAMFAMMPGIGGIVSKIPAIQKLGQKGMSLLPGKLASNSKLTQVESEVAEAIAANQQLVRQELSNHVAKLASTTAQKITDKSLKNTLLNIGQKGLSYTGKGAVSLAVGATPYIAAGQAYDKAYDEIQKDTPAGFTKNEQWGWDTLKSSFGSSGSKEDNELLKKAWSEGWRPGTVVPEKYQTTVYKTEYEEELANIAELESLVSGL
jgi:hypothetical protein